MIPKFAAVLIVGFWLCMTGLLLRSIWFPADSGLTVVEAGAVLELVAARGEVSALDIYDDRRLVGHLTVQATKVGMGAEALVRLRVNGQMSLNSALLPGAEMDLNCLMELDRAGQPQRFDFSVGTNKPRFQLMVEQSSGEGGARVRLTREGQVILEAAADGAAGAEESPMVGMLLGVLGISVADFKAMRGQAEEAASALRVEARQGEFTLGEELRQGFVVTAGRAGQRGFRMCVENTGEIVKVETPVSYHLLTESLRARDVALPGAAQ